MAYNSNKIEGSTLTPEQTASLFDTGILPGTDDYYRAKDVEETNKIVLSKDGKGGWCYNQESGVIEPNLP